MSARQVESIGVVGAGTMGTGIALLASLGGYRTSIYDPDAAALAAAPSMITAGLVKGAGKRWSAEDVEHAEALLATADSIEAMAGCDLVIEAAPESVELKRRLFAELADACGPEAILATNTSSLRVAEIAAETPRPERVVGMHFFNPPALMKLVEVVATEVADKGALEATTEVARRMGRTPILARDSPGFIANRLARPFSLESLRMLAEGVAPVETIDRVCRLGGGFRMGPFELLDLIGLDVNLSVARSFYEQGGEPERWRPSPIQEEMVAAGRLVRKSGEGFYRYDGDRHREVDPELGVEAPTLDEQELLRIDPAAPQILPRLLAQIANEAAFALEEEVGSPEDMNTAMRLGFNWPLGPIEFTEMLGRERAAALLEALSKEHGEAYRPAPRLEASPKREAE